ncbi:MAG: hypothetical protein ACJASY_001099 [Halioglobus sp.]|jgi:hypothetical protein
MRFIKYCSLICVALVLSACTTTSVDEYRAVDKLIALDIEEKFVVLGRQDAGHYITGADFASCVGRKMAGEELLVVEQSTFVDTMYPWFEPRVAPKSLGRLRRLLREPLLAKQIQDLDIRYMVWLDGQTETVDRAGSMSCSIGPGGAGCFGFTSWDKESTYEAVVWDIQTLKELGRVRVDSQGTSYLVGVLVPVPILSPVQGDACASLGAQLRDFFVSVKAS